MDRPRRLLPEHLGRKPMGSLAAIVNQMKKLLQDVVPETALRDARLIARKICKMDAAQYFANLNREVNMEEFMLMTLLLKHRLEGDPMQYVLCEQEFWNLRLEVGSGVLIPRPETEHLVEYALGLYPRDAWLRIADLGTGSAAIALAVAQHYEHARIEAIDISKRALVWARFNVKTFGLGNRISLIQDDMASALSGTYDLLLSNPPYIPTAKLAELSAEVNLEPREALDGGEDGLRFYRLLALLATERLNPYGQLVVEIGDGQQSDVEGIFTRAGLIIVDVIKDLAGIPRVIAAKRV